MYVNIHDLKYSCFLTLPPSHTHLPFSSPSSSPLLAEPIIIHAPHHYGPRIQFVWLALQQTTPSVWSKSDLLLPSGPNPSSDYRLVFDVHVKTEPNFKSVAIGGTLTCDPWPLQDGNLEMLEERLDEGKVDLNEPSYTPVPYTPLFIAFMNDHHQVGG